MSPEYVRPYVKAQKNDDRDAEAIAEAATRPTMRFVEVKSQAQSDMQSLHRARERPVAERTALINNLRAVLLERGITGHVAAACKNFPVTHRRHQRRGVDAADPRHRRQPAGGFISPRLGHELGIEGRDPLVQHASLLTEITD